MRNHFSKLALTAALALAITLTLSCSSDDGDVEVISSITQTIITYDANGDVTSTSAQRAETKYNSGGNGKTISYDASGNIIGQYEFKYDSRGNITKNYGFDRNIESELKYDNRGNITETVQYYSYGNIKQRIKFKYDSDGNQTESVSYDASGNMTSRLEYEYDSYGNQTKYVYYDASGSIALSTNTEYNCNGDGSFCTYNRYNDKGEISITGEATFTTINSKRLTTSYIGINSNGSGSKTETEYDSRGNTTKDTKYGRQSDTGNWVKRSETTRTYTYTRI